MATASSANHWHGAGSGCEDIKVVSVRGFPTGVVTAIVPVGLALVSSGLVKHPGPRHEQKPDQRLPRPRARFHPTSARTAERSGDSCDKPGRRGRRSSISPKARFPAAPRPRSRAGAGSTGTPSWMNWKRRRAWPESSGCGSSWGAATGSRRRTGPTTAPTSAPSPGEPRRETGRSIGGAMSRTRGAK